MKTRQHSLIASSTLGNSSSTTSEILTGFYSALLEMLISPSDSMWLSRNYYSSSTHCCASVIPQSNLMPQQGISGQKYELHAIRIIHLQGEAVQRFPFLELQHLPLLSIHVAEFWHSSGGKAPVPPAGHRFPSPQRPLTCPCSVAVSSGTSRRRGLKQTRSTA